MTRKQNKDLIIKFLENDEIKKIIYKMLYDDWYIFDLTKLIFIKINFCFYYIIIY